MTKAIIIGRKGDEWKAITSPIEYPEARAILVRHTQDSATFKGLDSIIVQPLLTEGAEVATRATIEARERIKGKLAEDEATPKKSKKPVAAVVALLLIAGTLCSFGQMEAKYKLNSVTLNQTNSVDGEAIGWQPDSVVTLQAYLTTTYGTQADTNDVVLTIDETLGGNYWKLATKTVTLDCGSTTNGSITLARITNNLGTLWWRVSELRRPVAATNTVTVNSLLIHQ